MTRRLDDIIEIDEIDFLKMNVQGSELSVLRNGKRRLAKTFVILRVTTRGAPATSPL